jgi:hypothetical protein
VKVSEIDDVVGGTRAFRIEFIRELSFAEPAAACSDAGTPGRVQVARASIGD